MKKQIAEKIKFLLGAALLFLAAILLELNLAVPIVLLTIVIYLKFAYKEMNLKPYRLLNLTLLFMIIFAVQSLFLRREGLLFYIPFSLVPMLATVLFANLTISFLLNVASSFTLGLMQGGDILLCAVSLVSGISSSILVLDARSRNTLIRAGFLTGVIQALTLLLSERFVFSPSLKYLALIANGIISSIIVTGVLPVFEYLFKTVTNISLLELADFNHPLLKRMILEAPGTYHHSLIVGNLSEAACQQVGAHALLARIGSYYHDIGKLQKAAYFSENQNINASKHDTLSPTISKMVIMNHVKEGAELARKHRLNSRLIDFILQHHGNSLVYYFYRKALENLEEDEDIREEGFRYPGPKPKSKETAIVLLADSVEAATRTLKDPSPADIEEMVHKIINNKFIDGQLDECDLTLKDIEIISQVFLRILNAMYHNRIVYPEEEKDADKHKKSAEENPRQPEET